ncbi:MAG: NlpC/P60 family protein [Mucilaginibacter sp.]
MKTNGGYGIAFLILIACNGPQRNFQSIGADTSGVTPGYTISGSPITHINTGKTTPAELLNFANSLTGIPYLYGSTDPTKGFDCSGFITYVFNHFNIIVPRRSVDFTDMDREINLNEAKTGDLILFTGTDSLQRVVGHMGIIIANSGQPLQFIHSTSGKAYCVTTTPLNSYYMGRYMKTIRIFKQNE